MTIGFWLARPMMALARIRYWAWERLNPDKPWLTPGAVRFCEACLAPPMRGWEYGSGRSTPWFARRLGHLVSVEHDADWHAKVREQLVAQRIENVDYRLTALDTPPNEPERAVYDPVPQYVQQILREPDESLDFVLVDGHYRTHCIRAAVEKLRVGGVLLVDDRDLWPDRSALPVPANWECIHESSNGLKRTVAWRKPVRSDGSEKP